MGRTCRLKSTILGPGGAGLGAVCPAKPIPSAMGTEQMPKRMPRRIALIMGRKDEFR